MTDRVVFAVPGNIETATGGYGYDRRMMRELRELGWAVDHLALSGGFPTPDSDDLAEAAGAFAAFPDGSLVLVDGLAFGAMPEMAEREGTRLSLVALVHHPLADETGLGEEARAAFHESERRSLRAARGVVATSRTTADGLVRNYGVDRQRLSVALPGTDPAHPSAGVGSPPTLLAVGSLTRRKGYDVLLDALATLQDLDWRCRIVGSAARDERVAADLREQVHRCGLERRVEFLGQDADPRREMADADLFVLATRHEGYGMVFAEAMSQGLPVVATQVGAVPEVVPDEAGLLVRPDDAAAFAAALRRMIADGDLRRRKAAGALAAGSSLPTWRHSAERLAAALREARR